MKVLLDENVPQEIRHDLAGHEVYTVGYLQWQGTRNGALLSRAASEGFDVLVTLDASMPSQQNVREIPTGLIVQRARSTNVEDVRPFVPALLRILTHFERRSVVVLYPGPS